MGLSIKEKIMKVLAAGLMSLVLATPAFAQHMHGHRHHHHFHGHHRLHHIHRHVPIIVHRHGDWVAPLVGGVIIGAVIADAQAKEKEEQTIKKVVCTEWKEIITEDGKIYKERTCKDL